MDYDTCDCYTVALCLRWLCGARMLAWMQPHGCLAPRDFSVSLNNLTNVKITTVYRRRQNTTQNKYKKVYNNTNPIFSSSLAHWFQTGACLCSHSPMFPQPNVHTALCSHISNIHYKIRPYVPTVPTFLPLPGS